MEVLLGKLLSMWQLKGKEGNKEKEEWAGKEREIQIM
jgi:hypothetical protein